MKYFVSACVVLMFTTVGFAQQTAGTPPAAAPAGRGQGRGGPPPAPIDPPDSYFSKSSPANLVEFEMMTWPEVYRAMHRDRKTTALFYVGGTEHRGPQNVNGGHTLMARETVKAIALQLGNAIAMPVLAYSPNNASNQQTGTIGLTEPLLTLILVQLGQQAINTGFKNVVFMGDHGGGQPGAYADAAKQLDDKYAALAAAENRKQDVHVYFCDEVYKKAQDDFDAYLKDKGYPVSTHAGIPDTSEMMYLGQGKDWVRTDLLPVAVGGRGQAPADPSAPRVPATGVQGDGRQSTIELGKLAVENKVNHAVRQIKEFLASQK
jgi:creatinine amidohydrolase/Fe(II)-dependent formamide hydrolase-like protein